MFSHRTAYRIALVCFLGLPLAAPAQTQDDFGRVAERLAPRLRTKAVGKLGSQQFRFAVFPFGDSDGKVTIQLHQPIAVLQGELISNLMRLAKGSYLVLDKPGLQKEFKAAGVDPSGIASNDPKNTANILNKIGVDVAVVGSIDAKSASQVAKDQLSKINISVTIIYKDGTADQLVGQAPPSDIPPPQTNYSGRFRVQLFRTGGGSSVELPLLTSKNPDSEHHKVFFAEVPDNLAFGSDGASYKIRISNKGTPQVKFDNPNDQQRVYGVAVLVDGVNSIYQDPGNGTVGPVVLHPRNVRKWILSGPGQRIVPDSSRANGYRLEAATDAQRYGHSVVDIPGFQRDTKTADKFLFAPPRESIAETVGITNDVGVITVHFYPEDMPNDDVLKTGQSASVRDLGTKPGSPVTNPVFAVRPVLKPNPVEVWRIFYRKKGDCPIQPVDQVPIDTASNENGPFNRKRNAN